jgi:hypothetical protein
MKRLMLSAITLALAARAAPAAADPTAPEPRAGTGHYDAPPIVIYGRPDRPHVVVEIKTPTAAAEARAAHASLHEALLRMSEPAALRAR